MRINRPSGVRTIAALCAAGFTLGVGAASAAEQVVVDFEDVVILHRDEVPNRVERWEEKGVVFRLAHEPRRSKARGRVMFFPHLSSGHKGILCAMAMEPIPVEARLPALAETVTVAFWGSTGCPARLDAYDAEGNLVDSVALPAVPGRKSPADPIPIFELTVSADAIAFIRFSGPRPGEYLAADEVRFTPTRYAVEAGS